MSEGNKGQEFVNLLLTPTNYNIDKVKETLKFCSAGHSGAAVIVGHYDGCFAIYECQRNECSRERWAVCCQCDKQRDRMYKKRSLTAHKSKQHKSKDKRKIPDTSLSPELASLAKKHQPASVAMMDSEDDEEEEDTSLFIGDDALHLVGLDEASEQPKQSKVFSYSHSICFADMPANGSLGFSSPRNENFFRYCVLRESGTLFEAGREYLIKKCLIATELSVENLMSVPPIPLRFQELLMEYAFLCFRTGKRNRDLLCGILSKLHNSGLEDGWISCQRAIKAAVSSPGTPPWVDGHEFVSTYIGQPFDLSKISEGSHRYSLDVPADEKSIRSRFVDGKFSILQNLPFPEVRTDIKDHAYISLEDCIRYALGIATCRVQVITPCNEEDLPDVCYHPSRSKSAQLLRVDNLSVDTLSCYLFIWSDDADTNSSSMQGRAQVWVKTMTIGAPAANGNWLENTYPVAIGLKSASHDAVEKVHADDLGNLRSVDLRPFFVGDINKMASCSFGVMANLGDQPEKRNMNGITLGGGTWGARSFVSANCAAIYQKLKACDSCVTEMKKWMQCGTTTGKLPPCKKCLNWDVLKPNCDLGMTKARTNYPFQGKPLSDGQRTLKVPGAVNRTVKKGTEVYVQPFRATYDGMRAAIQEAHFGYRDYNWSVAMATEFLKVELFNNAAIAKFFKYAENAKAYRIVTEETDESHVIDPAYKESILRAHQKSPASFEPMPLPSVCSRPGVPLSSHIEGFMHLTALGVDKKSCCRIIKVLKSMNANEEFVRTTAKRLLPVMALKLEWLKVMPYSGKKFHGWNAINWLAFARLTPWFYQNYDEVERQKVEVELPSEDVQEKWTKPQNEYWLKIRGFQVKSTAKAPELKEKVAEEMKKVPPPPIVPPPIVKSEHVSNLVNALYDMNAILYGNSVSEDTIWKAEYAIRIFLSCYDDLDTVIRGKKTQPSVISTYNCMCLLNLPDTMRTLGPLRQFWEGKIQGEGFLPFVKIKHTQGIRKNWAPNLMKNILRERTYMNLVGKTDEWKGEDSIGSSEYPGSIKDIGNLDKFKRYLHIYGAIDAVKVALETDHRDQKKPLSVLVVRDNDKPEMDARLFALVHSYEEVVEIVKAKGVEGEDHEKFGQHYYKFKLVEENEVKASLWSDEIPKKFSSPRMDFAVLLPLLNKVPIAGMFAVLSRNWVRLSPQSCLKDLVD